MKYVVFEHMGLVVFKDRIKHAQMVAALGDEPLAAGFVMPDLGLTGESTTLDLDMRPRDQGLLKFHIKKERHSWSSNSPTPSAR